MLSHAIYSTLKTNLNHQSYGDDSLMYNFFCRYSYQIPPGETNHSCGSADIWSSVVNNSDIFCSPGSYCPSTTRRVSCSSGY